MNPRELENEITKWISNLDIKQAPGCGDTSTCPTGNKYLTIMFDKNGRCFKDEGDISQFYLSITSAWKMWKLAFREYTAWKTGILYWRTKPELIMDIISIDGQEIIRYKIYARCFMKGNILNKMKKILLKDIIIPRGNDNKLPLKPRLI